MSKDVKDVKSLFPLFKDYVVIPAQGASLSSKDVSSKDGKEGKRRVLHVDDKVDWSSLDEQACLHTGSLLAPDKGLGASPGQRLAVPDSKSASSKHDEVLRARAGVAATLGVITPNDASVIRQLLLKQRSGTEKSAERKHIYTQGQFALGVSETTIPLCRVVGGTAVNTRLTNTIAVRHVTFRFSISRSPSGPSTVAAQQPIMRYLFWRDKIPASPGSAPTILGTDTNPPSSGTLILSRLGSANPIDSAIAVFNPITAMDYHVYECKSMCLNDKSTYDYVTPATAFGVVAPQKWHFDVRLDMHKVKQNYPAYTSTAPDVNDLYFTAFSDMDYSTQGFLDYLTYSVDTEFEDLQD